MQCNPTFQSPIPTTMQCNPTFQSSIPLSKSNPTINIILFNPINTLLVIPHFTVLYYFDQFVRHASHAKWFWTKSVLVPRHTKSGQLRKTVGNFFFGGNLLVSYPIQITYLNLKWLVQISGWSQVTRQPVGAKTLSTWSQVTPSDELIEIVQYLVLLGATFGIWYYLNTFLFS
jgi:hypothetical protein